VEETALGDWHLGPQPLRSPAENPGPGSGLAGLEYAGFCSQTVCVCFSLSVSEEFFYLHSHQKGK